MGCIVVALDQVLAQRRNMPKVAINLRRTTNTMYLDELVRRMSAAQENLTG